MADKSLYERLLESFRAEVAERPPRASAAVVPWRRADGGVEVYWVRRSPTMRFMGGWHAFPGGGLSRRDAPIRVGGTPAGTSESTFSPAEPGQDEAARSRLGADLVPGLLACAARELFEETGLLLDRRVLAGDEGDERGPGRLREARDQLLAGAVTFAELVAREGWRLDAAPLVFAGRWLTPPLAPLRFDNRFFLLEWPRERRLQPEIRDRELVDGEWLPPAEALDQWRRGKVLAAPPILHLLEVLADDGPDAGLGRLRDPVETHLGPFRRVEFRPGVVLLPLLTPTLPPATHTNAFLLGRREAVLVDPATPLEPELDRLRRALAAARERGLEITAIWLTHHHRDHVGAVEPLRRELGVPVLAHPASAGPLAELGIRVDGELRHEERIVLDGDPPFPVRVIHTPGHTRGHLAFFDETHRSLVAGDLLSSLSTIVIDPPEGDMDAYLHSIDRVLELDPATLFPAHGPAILDVRGKLEKLRSHRLAREAQVLAAWRRGRRRPEEMVAEVYPEVPPEVHPVAARQVQAHLDRLERLGEITT